MIRSIFIAVVTIIVSLSASAQVQTWKIDPNHTATQFSIKHLGISTVRGVFEKTTGTVQYDPEDPSKTVIEATIDAATVNTRVEMRDNDLRSPNFFDVAKYPNITFKSTKVEPNGEGKLKVTGDLAIHGMAKEVVLDVEGPTPPVQDKGATRMGVTATTRINRFDFGVNGAKSTAGSDVNITIDLELIAQ
jgi:polyisoprenoid-binding protein YceI